MKTQVEIDQENQEADILLGAIVIASRARNGILPSQLTLELLKQLANVLDRQEVNDALGKRIRQDFERMTARRPAGWR